MALGVLKDARKEYESINRQLFNVRSSQNVANQQAAELAIAAGTSYFGNDKPDAPKKGPKEKRIIVPLGKDDIDDLALDIERVQGLIKTFNDIILGNTINELHVFSF